MALPRITLAIMLERWMKRSSGSGVLKAALHPRNGPSFKAPQNKNTRVNNESGANQGWLCGIDPLLHVWVAQNTHTHT